MNFYQQRICLLVGCTARQAALVEAWMRCERPTLDDLDAAMFKAEALESLACVLVTEDAQNVRLAESFGLEVPDDDDDKCGTCGQRKGDGHTENVCPDGGGVL